MENNEGPTTETIPSYTYKSCRHCKFYDYRLVVSGRNPIYRSNCNHHDSPIMGGATFGNLANGDRTPNWCPFVKTTERVIPEGHLKAAIEVVLAHGGSTGAVQRKLKIGYFAASKLMDEMERIGVIGPVKADGSKRDVLIKDIKDL